MCTSEDHVVNVRPLGPLTFVFFDEPECPGTFSSHCLELDIGGSGASRESALEDLKDAIETLVLHHYELEEDVPLRRAPEELWQITDRKTFHLLLVWGMDESEASFHEVTFMDPPPVTFESRAIAPSGH